MCVQGAPEASVGHNADYEEVIARKKNDRAGVQRKEEGKLGLEDDKTYVIRKRGRQE